MSFDAIRMGRIPRKEKEKSLHAELDESVSSECAVTDHEDSSASLNSQFNIDMSNRELNSSAMINNLRESSLKFYQEYCSEKFSRQEQYLNVFICEKIKHDKKIISIREVFVAASLEISLDMKCLSKNLHHLPGLLSCLDYCDFHSLLSENLFSIYILTTHKLFYNEEYFYFLPNGIQCSLYWMRKMLGDRGFELYFDAIKKLNQIRASEAELALLIPYIITQHDNKDLNDVHSVKKLNNLYEKALMKELNMNKRFAEFLMCISEIIRIFPFINKYAKENTISIDN
jgi:hypothetical protein